MEEVKKENPTAENIARGIYQGLLGVANKHTAKILEIRVHEGPGNIAVFYPLLSTSSV